MALWDNHRAAFCHWFQLDSRGQYQPGRLGEPPDDFLQRCNYSSLTKYLHHFGYQLDGIPGGVQLSQQNTIIYAGSWSDCLLFVWKNASRLLPDSTVGA